MREEPTFVNSRNWDYEHSQHRSLKRPRYSFSDLSPLLLLCAPLPPYSSFFMAVSDTVVGNLTTIYVALIAVIKAYGLVCGRSFSGGFVVIVSSTLVGLVLVATLTWDVSRKVTHTFTRFHGGRHHSHSHPHEMCKGGICWHGVAVRSTASQVRFRLPRQIPYATL